MIAAAGLGSRLGHGLPKCMLEVGGVPILTRMIETLEAHTDRVHVVVGYREEMVIDYVSAHHRNVVLVRNPDFRRTNTIDSYLLGAIGLTGPLLFVDGDLVIRPSSLESFLHQGALESPLVGVTPSASEDGVFVFLEEDDGVLHVQQFRREPPSPFEWANVLLAAADVLVGHTGFVYQALEPLLPLPAGVVDVAEVDTEQDLRRTRAVVADWERQGE